MKNNIGTGFFNSGKYNSVRDYTPLLIPEIKRLFPQVKPLAIAEIGSGSGLFTQTITQSGIAIDKLFLIEPDEKAIEQHKALFQNNPCFNNLVYINASADDTKLKEHSIDGLFCMQAFHWLDRKASRAEFLRILKKNGKLFISGKFLMPHNEASTVYISMTRFGKRKDGMKDNREAYTQEVMSEFFGHTVEKQIVCRETEHKTLEQLKALMQLRIDSSGDDTVKDRTASIQEQTEQFFKRYAASDNTVAFISETFYYCDSLGVSIE